MDYSNYIITEYQFEQYRTDQTGKLAEIIDDILLKLPENIRKEAANKMYLVKTDELVRDTISVTYSLEFRSPSKQLKEAVEKVYRQIIVLKD